MKMNDPAEGVAGNYKPGKLIATVIDRIMCHFYASK